MKTLEIAHIFDIGVSVESSKLTVENHQKFPNLISASVGIDPEIHIPGSELYIEFSDNKNEIEKLKNFIYENKDKIAMIGETGIDLYWLKKQNIETQSSITKQKELFKSHIELSHTFKKPLTIHSRNAIQACIDILKEKDQTSASYIKGVFHSLTPDIEDNENSFYTKCKTILEMGYFIGINGILTFKNATIIRNTFVKILKENYKSELTKIEPHNIYESGFVLETDGPYLAPTPIRGTVNTPGNIKIIFDFIKTL